MTATQHLREPHPSELTVRWPAGPDGLSLVPVPLAPEVRLHLATDPIVLWARMEAEAKSRLAAPFWASAWLGGQALARFVLDQPALVAGRRVLDLAAGSGVAGIAACLAGAAAVTANDIDPHAATAIAANAKANGVEVTISCASMADEATDVDVVLVGDVFYSESMAQTALAVLERASAGGAQILVGDPGRANLPLHRLEIVATYSATRAAAVADAEVKWVHVLRLR